jgi:hypothetical protein
MALTLGVYENYAEHIAMESAKPVGVQGERFGTVI